MFLLHDVGKPGRCVSLIFSQVLVEILHRVSLKRESGFHSFQVILQSRPFFRSCAQTGIKGESDVAHPFVGLLPGERHGHGNKGLKSTCIHQNDVRESTVREPFCVDGREPLQEDEALGRRMLAEA